MLISRGGWKKQVKKGALEKFFAKRYKYTFLIDCINETKYSRVDQVKSVEDSL